MTTLFEQMTSLVEKTKTGGREPKSWQIMPEKITEVESDAEAAGVLVKGRTIYGVPYAAVAPTQGQGVLLIYEDGPPEGV